MKIFSFTLYTLILSHDPCDVFKFYKVTEMHGLNLEDCENYNNTMIMIYIKRKRLLHGQSLNLIKYLN
jgi:hypothetical protein